jgi:pimeloyl-ACP methyl ester carboxylesterase
MNNSSRPCRLVSHFQPNRRITMKNIIKIIVISIFALGLISQPVTAQTEGTGFVQRSNTWHDPSPHQVRLIAVEPEISLEVLDWGGVGEALIFMPGAGDSAHSFDEFAPRFRDTFRVLAITRRGFGASSQPEEGYNALRRARDVVTVLDSLGIDRAVFAGHSFGGDELTHVASAYPERVHALVYLDAYDYGGRLLQRQGEIQWPLPKPMLAEDSASVAAVQAYFSRERGVDILEAEIRATGKFDDSGRWAGWLDAPGVLRQTMQGVTAYDYSSIDAPALAIYAKALSTAELFPSYAEYDDEARTLADRAFSEMQPYIQASIERFRSEVSRGEILLIPGAHHYVHYSNPGEVERAILDFLAPIVWPAGADTVHVAPPTGEQETDRASIMAALEVVQPGGIIQFATGTYMLGKTVSVQIPRVTLQGHPEGTTLRVCDPSEIIDVRMADLFADPLACIGLELIGGHQTVRGFSFEYAFHALNIGCCYAEAITALEDGGDSTFEARGSDIGGYRVENNVFSNLLNAIRVLGDWQHPAVIRRNTFVNTFHALVVHGRTVHFLDNDISAPAAERVPAYGHPGYALAILPWRTGLSDCSDNVVAGNRIQGYPEVLSIFAGRAGVRCLRNVFRENIIDARPANPDSASPDSVEDGGSDYVVWVPVSIRNQAGDGSVIAKNLIEGNQIAGAEGLVIEIHNASRNRIVNNRITSVTRRDPLPDLPDFFPDSVLAWTDANGSAIWVSPGSDGNEIVDNTFEEIASHPVVLEGDSNVVQMLNGVDMVRDLGSDNRVTDTSETYESKFIEVNGLRLHYLDFGGTGLPVVFVHSESWDAYTYKDFAPRFSDSNRVLAVTRRGYGQSEGHSGDDVAGQAQALIDFLDALEIDRAVFAGNSSPTALLTYLAEYHPERVSGVVYLAGMMPWWLREELREADTTRALEMAWRASYDPAARERFMRQDTYKPGFVRSDYQTIDIPALAFASRSGTIGLDRLSEPLWLVGSPLLRNFYQELPPSPLRDWIERLVEDDAFRSESLEQIRNSTARVYLMNLAADDSLQSVLQEFQIETVGPALVAGQERFRQAFGGNLRLVRLDVPLVHGYEYRDGPELIEPYIRQFLNEHSHFETKR